MNAVTPPRRVPARRFASRWLAAPLALAAIGSLSAQSYTWNYVRIGGGGYVTGIFIHPKDPNLIYIRTDVGGAYRWDSPNQRWIQLCDGFSNKRDYQVDAMAVDPSDTSKTKVYIGTGDGSSRSSPGPGKVYRSSNQGTTWTDTGLPSAATLHGNGDNRWAGDRLVIDPNKPGRAYLGSRSGGLFRCTNIDTSTSGSSNWSSVSGVPAGSAGIGVTFVVFDQSAGVNGSGFTNNIFVGVWGSGVYRSTNAGTSWSAMSGSPSNPLRGAVDPSGKLYVTHSSGVAKWSSGSWSNISPNANHFAGIDIHPADANKIVVAQRLSGNSQIYLSTNGGTSWTSKAGTNTNAVGWQPTGWFSDAVSCIRFGPTTNNPNKVWFTDWYNIWKTNDITASSPSWNNYENGHEELVMHTLRAPSPNGTSNVILWSGAADISGLRHRNLNAFPDSSDKLTGDDIQSIDVFEGNNNIVYRVAGKTDASTGNGWRSGDSGATWTAFNPGSDPVLPDNARSGRIAVSALSGNLIVWVPRQNEPFYSTDGGVNWNASTGTSLPDGMVDGWEPSHFLASNKTGTNRFYIYKPNVGFYRSNTGSSAGSTWSLVSGSGLPSTSTFKRYGIKTVPGQDGGVWANVGHDNTSSNTGVWKSTNYGTSFTKLSNVLSAEHIAFGVKASGSSHPATVYIFGRITGDSQNWLYRSNDMGANWTRINSTALQFSSGVKALEADREVYGRVFVATSGRSIFYGEP